MCICAVRGRITLLHVELFVSGKLHARGKRLLQGVNVSGFTRGKALKKYVCQHFLKEILYLFIVSCWHLKLLLLPVAEGM